MPIKAEIGLDVLYGFLLTIARVGGALILIPMPGFQAVPTLARVVVVVATTDLPISVLAARGVS